jgi:hypothetical protein
VKGGKKKDKKNSFGDKRKENFLLENGNERFHSGGLCECGREMDVKEICLRRALNNILMNPGLNRKFHKFLGELDKLSNHLASQEILYVVYV